MSGIPSITVVVPSFNGERTLPELFKALENQTYKDFEVLIVVDGSTDNTVSLKEGNWNLNLHWIEQENKGRAGARNAGAGNANNNILLFLDDDTKPEQDVVRTHLKHHQKHKNSVLVGNVPFDADSNKNDFPRFREYLSKKWLSQLPTNSATPLSEENPFINAANFSIRKKVFKRVGGFNTGLTDNEDFDLAVRLSGLGIPIYFDKFIVVWHQDGLSVKSYIERLRAYRKSYQQLMTDYSVREFRPKYHKFEDLNILKKTIYRLVCKDQVLQILIRTPLYIRMIPEVLRFKIYDLALTGYSNYFPELEIRDFEEN